MGLKINKNYNETEESWMIDVQGEVDIHSSGNLKDTLNDLLNEREANLRINCDHLSYIDSTGLGVLIGILKRVKKNDNNIYILGAKSSISKLLKITGLDKIFIMNDHVNG